MTDYERIAGAIDSVRIEAVTPGEFRQGGRGLTIRYGRAPSPFGDVFVALTERGVCSHAVLFQQHLPWTIDPYWNPLHGDNLGCSQKLERFLVGRKGKELSVWTDPVFGDCRLIGFAGRGAWLDGSGESGRDADRETERRDRR